MGVLRVNLALQEIDVSGTSWARDGKAAQIQEALQQNQKRAVYMSVFLEANLPFGDAKAGRLFLCGSPRAALGQHFQAKKSESSYRTSSYASKDGFVSESVFAGLIEKFLEKQPRFQNVDKELLEKILIDLDLCFKLEDTSEYFIPSFIPEHASKKEQNDQEGAHAKWMNWENRSETLQFVGIRIQCQDGKTMSLTVAFFLRFQELISFCASPKGCPGVALVLGVIQTVCVEMLIPSHLRGAILIEKLQWDLLRSINDKLEEMPLERWHLMEKEELFDYKECWPPIERYTSEKSERARDLLLESDVEAVVNKI
ncbi:hypothetical protein AXG93_441s1010 [Marchantia polymorpha subsp. ruderalis]|uniref:Uncharacterized protein n=1 Tax=Marchantia polymorpha subsp. ruderalis TaxID=1480154 RepID=A0A176W400_MARPO|nr:hypothetical protein AXG93_441s1010 [Marchantia polymorpha subsp. ruderalis]